MTKGGVDQHIQSLLDRALCQDTFGPVAEKEHAMNKPWFMYPFTIIFGDTSANWQLGGAHDLDIGAPANYEVTALLPGTISSITDGFSLDSHAGRHIWGKQVGVELAVPYNGKRYMAYLHLSAVNPELSPRDSISKGHLIGWVGGGNVPDDYGNSTNPTGTNYLNSSDQSSRIQVGVALMDGSEYGKAGWVDFPPVRWALDPTQIILDARKDFIAHGREGEDEMLQITDPFAKQYFSETVTTGVLRWHCKEPHHNHDVIGGILAFYRKIGGAPRLPISGEMRPDPHQNVVYQEFEAGVIVYDPGHTLPHPPGFDESFLLLLTSDEVKRIVCV
jgi:hypothetical protein